MPATTFSGQRTPEVHPDGDQADYEKMTAMSVLNLNERPAEPFGLFLDFDTGIPLPNARSQKPTASHAPLSSIKAEIHRLRPLYLVCFDQSQDRSAGPKRKQRERKRAALGDRNVASFYYVSHAPLLFAAREERALGLIRQRLVQSGIPQFRLEPPGANECPEADD